MNPYVAAVNFVLAENASDRDVIHTVSRIASEIAQYMKIRGLLE